MHFSRISNITRFELVINKDYHSIALGILHDYPFDTLLRATTNNMVDVITLFKIDCS